MGLYRKIVVVVLTVLIMQLSTLGVMATTDAQYKEVKDAIRSENMSDVEKIDMIYEIENSTDREELLDYYRLWKKSQQEEGSKSVESEEADQTSEKSEAPKKKIEIDRDDLKLGFYMIFMLIYFAFMVYITWRVLKGRNRKGR